MIAGGVNIGQARLNVDGSPATFGSGGWTGFDVQPGTDQAAAIGLQSSGKIVLAGNSNTASPSTAGTQSALVARFKDNGAIGRSTLYRLRHAGHHLRRRRGLCNSRCRRRSIRYVRDRIGRGDPGRRHNCRCWLQIEHLGPSARRCPCRTPEFKRHARLDLRRWWF